MKTDSNKYVRLITLELMIKTKGNYWTKQITGKTFNVAVLGLHGQALVAGGYESGYCYKLQKFLPCLAAPNLDMLLDKAGPIRNYGNSSVIT